MKFCKVFDSEKWGQLVVMRKNDDDGDPCLAVYADLRDLVPGATVSVATVSVGGDPSDEQMLSALEKVDLTGAEELADSMFGVLMDRMGIEFDAAD